MLKTEALLPTTQKKKTYDKNKNMSLPAEQRPLTTILQNEYQKLCIFFQNLSVRFQKSLKKKQTNYS